MAQYRWGATAIAEELNILDENGEPNPKKVYHLFAEGHLRGVVKVGRRLVGTPQLGIVAEPIEETAA
jgi:hypothetical protein